MDPHDISTILSLVPFKDIFEAALLPSARKVGETLESIFSLVSTPIIAYSTKNKFKYDYDVEIHRKSWEDYAKQVSININSIPQNKLIVPDLHKIAPIVDQSKYYISEESYRLRFAELIAACCDKDSRDKVKQIHTHVLQNMSSVDAHVFNFICQNLPNTGFDILIPRFLSENSTFIHEQNPYSQCFIVNKKSILDESIKLERNIIDIDDYDDKLISETIDTLLTLGLFTKENRVILNLMNNDKCADTLKKMFPFFLESETYNSYSKQSTKMGTTVTCQPYVLVLTTLGESYAHLTNKTEFTDISK